MPTDNARPATSSTKDAAHRPSRGPGSASRTTARKAAPTDGTRARLESFPPWRIELLVALVAGATYANAPFNGFTLDDRFIVLNNPQVTEPGRWRESWTTDLWSVSMGEWSARDLLYRPLTLNTFRFIWWIVGDRAGPQIALNTLLHAIICALLVRWLRGWGLPVRAALIAGVAFAVLPIHVEAVANAVGRADLLATLFTLLALLACRRSDRDTSGMASVVAWIGLSGLCAFAAMASKESGLAAVAAIVFSESLVRARGDVRPRNGALEDSFPERARSDRSAVWRRLPRLAPALLATVIYLALRHYALDGQWRQPAPVTRGANLLADTAGLGRILGAAQLWGMYWAKTFWPAVLGIGYTENAVRSATSPFEANILFGAAVAMALAAWSIVSWRRGNRLPAALAMMLVIAYAPTSNLFILLRVFLAERIWYLPSLFLAALLGLALERAANHRTVAAALAVVAIGMMGRCWIRTPEWRDNGTLYAAAFRDQPQSSHVLSLYGDWLARRGEYQRGVELLHRALAINLGATEVYRSLGRAHLQHGNYEEAVRSLRAASLQVPGHKGIESMLKEPVDALAARSQGEIDRLREAAEAAPHDVERQVALLEALQRTGRIPDAFAFAGTRDADFADEAKWHASIASLLIHAGRRDDAALRYERALELAPQDAQRTVELGILLLERRSGDDLARATALSARAMELAPNSPTVWMFRAEVLALAGDRAAARTFFERALKVLPQNHPQRAFVAERIRTLGG